MKLPFTREEFLEVFAAFNTAIWPLQIVAVGMGLLTIGLLLQSPTRANRTISAVLGVLWLMSGIGYHWLFFSAINPAAYLFGAAFVAASAIFFVEGVVRGRILFTRRAPLHLLSAGVLGFYSLLLYPALGLLATHPYPTTPLFGVAPCPTVIFTLALLLLARHPTPWLLAVVPLAWSVIGGSAAVALDVPEDWALFVAALVWVALVVVLPRVTGRVRA
jgi:hypothetical protein